MATINIPQIRFKGFEGEWDKKILGEVVTICSMKRVHQSDWTTSGIRFFRARDVVAAFKNEEIEPIFISEEKYREYSSLCGKVSIGDLLVTGVGTIGVPYLIKDSNPIYIKDGNIIWMKNNGSFNGEFLYHCFCGNKVQQFIKETAGTGTVGTYTIANGKKTPIDFTSLPEQNKIASLFTSLDKQISTSEAKLDKLRTIKKTLLKKMFADQDELTPQIRFKGFDGAWEEKRLGEIANRLTRRNSNNECDLPLTIASQYGLIDQREYFNFRVASSNITNYFLLKKGEFAYNKSTSDGYPWGSIKRLDRYPMGVLSTLYIIFELKNNSVVSDYVVSYYNTKNWYNSVKKIAAEGARNHGLLNISPIEFFTTNIQLPQNKKEQTKIASLFTSLDKQISNQEQKIEKLKAIKKTLLKKMFV